MHTRAILGASRPQFRRMREIRGGWWSFIRKWRFNHIKMAGRSAVWFVDSAFMRSPEPASNNATLAVVGRFEVEGIRRFVRENYYSFFRRFPVWKKAELLDEYWIEKIEDQLAISKHLIKALIKINRVSITGKTWKTWNSLREFVLKLFFYFAFPEQSKVSWSASLERKETLEAKELEVKCLKIKKKFKNNYMCLKSKFKV